MPQISAVVFAAIALLAIMIAIDATPIDRLTARHGNLVYHQPVIRESVGSEPGHPRTKEEQTTEMINAATGVTVALTGALASTGALPELKDAAHKGVQTVHTAIHHVQDKVHNATTEMKVGEEKVKEHLPFHHHPKDYDEPSQARRSLHNYALDVSRRRSPRDDNNDLHTIQTGWIRF